jgi:DNA-binding GntR family transcriptional regulator
MKYIKGQASANTPQMDSAASAPDLGIHRQSLTSAVADKLRERIVRGDIPEGA